MKGLLSYVEGARAAAVRRAQAAGRYEQLDGLRLALATHGAAAVTLQAGHGDDRRRWNDIGRAPGCGCSAAPRRAWGRWRCG